MTDQTCFCGGYRAGDVVGLLDPVQHTLTSCNVGRIFVESSCATCRFWQRGPEQPNMGRCRRYPVPQAVKKETAWCGEHDPCPVVVRLEESE